MKRIKGVKKQFENIEIGDIFSMSEEVEINETYPGYIPYFNIKVENAVSVKYFSKGTDAAFNTISLNDGRLRTFHVHSDVYVFNKKDIFLSKKCKEDNDNPYNIDYERQTKLDL